MIYKCDDCKSNNIVELTVNDVNTGEFVEVVDDSIECFDCKSRTIVWEEE